MIPSKQAILTVLGHRPPTSKNIAEMFDVTKVTARVWMHRHGFKVRVQYRKKPYSETANMKADGTPKFAPLDPEKPLLEQLHFQPVAFTPNSRKEYDPTPEEIKQRCLEVQSRWSPSVERMRRGLSPEPQPLELTHANVSTASINNQVHPRHGDQTRYLASGGNKELIADKRLRFNPRPEFKAAEK